MKKIQHFFISLSVLLLIGQTQISAQIATANAVPFTSATTSTETGIKIPYGTFLPLYATSDNPTTFHIDDETQLSKLTLPANSTFGGQKYDTPGYKGWTFPTAKSEIQIIIGNNTTQTSKMVRIWAWENPGVGKKPVLAGTILIELLPPSQNSPPGPKPDPTPKPKPDPPSDLQKYAGKLSLLILEQTEDAVQVRGQLFQSQEMKDVVSKYLVTPPRIVDIDAKTAEKVFPKDLQAYKDIFLKTSNAKLPYYFLVAKDGTIVRQGNVPLDDVSSVLGIFK